MQCFPDGFSSKLGLPYIIKTFEWFLVAENRFLFHVAKGDEIIGYCGGFSPQFIGDGSTSGILQYAMKQAFKGVLKNPLLLLHKELFSLYPVIAKNIYRKIFNKKSKGKPGNKTNSIVFEKRIGLVVIGVHPAYRGKGVFEILMKEFENETRKRRLDKMVLSVKKDNVRAIRAYEKAGWLILKEHDQTLEMYKLLSL